MRITILLCALGCMVLPLLPAAAQGQLALIDYGQDTALRERLVQDVAVFADIGGKVVARVNPAAAVELTRHGVSFRSLPEPRPGEVLAVVALRSDSRRPTGVAILHEEAGFALVAGLPAAMHALKRPGLVDGGVQTLDLTTPYAPTPAVNLAAVDAPDPRIASLVAQVQTANLTKHIKALSDLWTRRADQPENAQAVQYLKDELAKLPGVTVKVESFNTRYGPNVIAEIPGLETPDEIVMIGGHFDSLAGSSRNRAPGADDNASGSATVLELARIFASAPMQKTLRFGWWNAEEMGLYGSAAYASAAKTRGDKILAYLNTDMNAYRATGDTVDVDFIQNDSTPSLITQLTQISQTYVPSLGVKQGYLYGGTSDHRSFYRNGFPAVFYFEDLDKYSPYIHSSNDDMVQSTNDMNLATLISQSILAGAATIALPLDPPAFTLSVSQGPSVGGTRVTASGSFLKSTTAVTVGGQSVPFTVAGATVTFDTPVSPILGAVPVEITNPGGAGKSSFTYVLTQPPALRIPAEMKPGATASGAVGGPAGHVAITLFSLFPGQTNMGLITLDIGAGNVGNNFYYHVGPLSPTGGTAQIPLWVPNDPQLLGFTFHFQSAVVEPSLQSIAKTNVSTLAVK